MKVCIFGAGAIGGHLAVRLFQAGADTSVIARGAHLEAIRTDGLRLRDGGGEVVTRPRASDSAAEIGPQDLVIVTVKTPALVGIADELARLIGPRTTVAFVINGLPWWYLSQIEPDPGAWSPPVRRIVEAMQHSVGVGRAIGGVAYSANHVAEPGVIFNSSPASNEFVFGAVEDGAVASCDALVAALMSAGLASRQVRPLAPVIWKKLMLNVITGPSGALTGATSRRLLTDPALEPVIDATCRETVALAAACGMENVAPDLAKIAQGIADHKSSMLQDYELGRKPEIDTLVGALCDLGRLKGVPVPTLDMLYALARTRASTLGLHP